MKKRVVLGISGGVDSAVSAYILKKSGYEVIGVYLSLHSIKNELLSELDILRNSLKIDIIEHNCENEFKDCVISPFIKSYIDGKTPNPCIKCNPQLKFRTLFRIADELGVPFVSTGHYAGISGHYPDRYLIRGQDRIKDQSYMLYRLDKKWLNRIIFPLGSMDKDTVKSIAEDIIPGNPGFKKESQDICFLKGQTLFDFLKGETSSSQTEGKIIDRQGNILGKHKGIFSYTIGQRKGLGLSGGPWFVHSIDPDSNILVVSGEEDIKSDSIYCEEAVWHNPLVDKNEIFQGQHRYRAKPFRLRISSAGEGNFTVKTCQPVKAAAPGQALVIYQGNRVIGGGTIIASNKEE